MDTGSGLCAYYNSAEGYVQTAMCNTTDPTQLFSWSGSHLLAVNYDMCVYRESNATYGATLGLTSCSSAADVFYSCAEGRIRMYTGCRGDVAT